MGERERETERETERERESCRQDSYTSTALVLFSELYQNLLHFKWILLFFSQYNSHSLPIVDFLSNLSPQSNKTELCPLYIRRMCEIVVSCLFIYATHTACYFYCDWPLSRQTRKTMISFCSISLPICAATEKYSLPQSVKRRKPSILPKRMTSWNKDFSDSIKLQLVEVVRIQSRKNIWKCTRWEYSTHKKCLSDMWLRCIHWTWTRQNVQNVDRPNESTGSERNTIKEKTKAKMVIRMH